MQTQQRSETDDVYFDDACKFIVIRENQEDRDEEETKEYQRKNYTNKEFTTVKDPNVRFGF